MQWSVCVGRHTRTHTTNSVPTCSLPFKKDGRTQTDLHAKIEPIFNEHGRHTCFKLHIVTAGRSRANGPACLTNTTNMIGGRRTFQTYIAAIKHDYLLFVDSIVCSSCTEITMTTDQLHSSFSWTQKIKPVSLLLISAPWTTWNMKHHTDSAQHSSTATAAAVHPNHTNRLARKRRGLAETQVPTTRNYTLELPTFGVSTMVNPIEVQWKGLTLRGLPPWSQCLPCLNFSDAAWHRITELARWALVVLPCPSVTCSTRSWPCLCVCPWKQQQATWLGRIMVKLFSICWDEANLFSTAWFQKSV